MAKERTATSDGGPTKRWFAEIQLEPQYASYVDLAWGKRPKEELYDLRSDPDQMRNLADSPRHEEARNQLAAQLMQILKDSGDPRVDGEGGRIRQTALPVGSRSGPKEEALNVRTGTPSEESAEGLLVTLCEACHMYDKDRKLRWLATVDCLYLKGKSEH